MVEDDQVTVSLEPLRKKNCSLEHGTDRSARNRFDFQAVIDREGCKLRVTLTAEVLDDGPLDGPGQRPLHGADVQRDRLSALLTGGESAAGGGDGDLVVVMPRPGTVSPWASKATDIAHHCGLTQVRRIERGVEYTVVMKSGLLGGKKTLSDEARGQVAAAVTPTA